MPKELFNALNPRNSLAGATSDGTDLAFPFRNLTSTVVLISPRESSERYRKLSNGMFECSRFLREMRFYHIFPDALREPQLMSSKYPLEEHGENLASVLTDMKRKHSPYFSELLSTLGQVVPGVEDISVTRADGKMRHVNLVAGPGR